MIKKHKNLIRLISWLWPDREFQKSGTEILVYCPYCASEKKKLSINPEKGVFQCWTCQKKGKLTSFLRYLKHAGYITQRDYSAVVTGIGGLIYDKITIPTPEVVGERYWSEFTPCVFPEGCERFEDVRDTGVEGVMKQHVRDYLVGRGFSSMDIQDYNIHVVHKAGDRFTGHLFFPIYDAAYRQLVYWTTRTTLNSVPKTYHSGSKYSRYAARDVLFNGYRVRKGYPMAICEGPFDAFSVTKHVMPAVALLGKVIHKSHLEYIMRMKPSGVYICLDEDAVSEKASIQRQILALGLTNSVVIVQLSGKDPNDMDPDDLKRDFDKARKTPQEGVIASDVDLEPEKYWIPKLSLRS